ncbi:MAG: hypothetical protein HY561_13810, partial [Gemmatimonadetes bacterium]|nr:hypothetical protein [Gemmatimonadota bacterium]
FAESEDRELIEAAERLYVREKGWVDWRAREGLAERLPRMREFARGLAWLRANEPERHTRLARAVRRYRRRLALLGAGDADVPPRYGALRVARFITRQGLVLGLGFPLGVLGGALWYPVYRLPRLALTLVRLDYEAVATYKLVTAVLATPLVYAFWLWVAWDFAGTPGVGVAAPVLPVLGLVALAWTGRWRRAQEDARLFLRVLLHPRQRDRLAAQRAALVAEFDAVARDLAASDAAAARSMPVAGA